ncbi:MAG: GAF domain-containing protein [Vulcanimicrobiota bacterium]
MSDNKEELVEQLQELKQENHRLRQENKKILQGLEKKLFGNNVKKSLYFLETTKIINSVQNWEQAVRLFLEMTCKIVHSEAASLILYDWKTDELYFEEAVGEKAREVKKFRMKPYEGIAGYCFTTGTALAIADVTKDARHKKEIVEELNMKQKALMAAPLIYQQEVIGVMETVNRDGGGTFTAGELELLTSIANFASIFLNKSRLFSSLYSLFLLILKEIALNEKLEDFTARDFVELSRKLEEDYLASEDFSETTGLAALVREISATGPEETRLVRTILKDFRNYLKEKGLLDKKNLDSDFTFDY